MGYSYLQPLLVYILDGAKDERDTTGLKISAELDEKLQVIEEALNLLVIIDRAHREGVTLATGMCI